MISTAQFEQLLGLIPEYPGTNLYMVDGEGFEGIEHIVLKTKQIDARLDLLSLPAVMAKNTKYDDHTSVFVKEFTFEQERYNVHQRQYDFIFVAVDAGSLEDIEQSSKKFYRITKNAGYVFFFSKPEKTPYIKQVLEDNNFVAINTIDISQDYDIISAKKMHGWEQV
ncbi:MAG: hypothetical protein DSY80_04340 [Desulfocapsa sp.]|nr:MAG: hypothetical protein DSY80_04340 [Desulfocapsa sp.]